MKVMMSIRASGLDSTHGRRASSAAASRVSNPAGLAWYESLFSLLGFVTTHPIAKICLKEIRRDR